jgi:hypothetical protein
MSDYNGPDRRISDADRYTLICAPKLNALKDELDDVRDLAQALKSAETGVIKQVKGVVDEMHPIITNGLSDLPDRIDKLISRSLTILGILVGLAGGMFGLLFWQGESTKMMLYDHLEEKHELPQVLRSEELPEYTPPEMGLLLHDHPIPGVFSVGGVVEHQTD